MKKEFKIVSVHSQKIDDLVSFLNLALGQGNEAYRKSVDLWTWKHLSTPFGKSYGLAAIEPEKKEIIGMRVFMNWKFHNDRDEVVCSPRAVDTATHPSYQRQGIFSSLNQKALNDFSIQKKAILISTPNKRSKAGNLKMGWEVIASWPLYVLIIKPIPFLKGIILGKRKKLKQFQPLHENVYSENILTFEELKHSFGENILNVFFEKIDQTRKRNKAWRVKKDFDYIEWRYNKHPNVDYGFFPLIFNKQLVGLAILRSNIRFGMTEIVVSELFIEENNFAFGKKIIQGIKKNINADYLIAHFNLFSPELLLIKKAGFIKMPGQKIDFNIKEISFSKEFFNKKDNWNFSLGDLELF